MSVVDCELTLTGSGVDLGFVLKGQITERGKEIFVTAIQSAQPIVAAGPYGLAFSGGAVTTP